MNDRERMAEKAREWLGSDAEIPELFTSLSDLLLSVLHEEREGCEEVLRDRLKFYDESIFFPVLDGEFQIVRSLPPGPAFLDRLSADMARRVIASDIDAIRARGDD